MRLFAASLPPPMKKQPYHQPFLTLHRPPRALAAKVMGECALLLVFAGGPASGKLISGLATPASIAHGADDQPIGIKPLTVTPRQFSPLKTPAPSTDQNIKRPGEKTGDKSTGEKTVGEKRGEKQPSEKNSDKTTTEKTGDKTTTEKTGDKTTTEKTGDKTTTEKTGDKSPTEKDPSEKSPDEKTTEKTGDKTSGEKTSEI